jgi:hypothetical protein
MPYIRTRILLAAATFMSGILAGTVVDRVLVGGPAWHGLGPEVWAQFSQRADLGTGLIAYPVEAIGTTLLLIAAGVSSHFDRITRWRVPSPLIAAVALSLLTLLITAKAAPIMLSLSICAALSTCWRLLPQSGHCQHRVARTDQKRRRTGVHNTSSTTWRSLVASVPIKSVTSRKFTIASRNSRKLPHSRKERRNQRSRVGRHPICPKPRLRFSVCAYH